MTTFLVAVIVALLAGLAALGLMRARDHARHTRTRRTAPRRILLPFLGEQLSQRALDAALRLARADGATLVPAYLARVSYALSLDSALPRQCSEALPLLEAIEQRATSLGIPVDARIERGRDARHALRELIAHEHYDRMVIAASAQYSGGFESGDVAWLLDHAPGEILVLRAAGAEPERERAVAAQAAATATASPSDTVPAASVA